MSSLLQTLKNAHEYVKSNPKLNQALQALILIGVFFGLYRFVMSSYAAGIRRFFPFLNFWKARREVRSLLKEGEYARAGDILLERGQFDQAIEIFQEGDLFARAADVYMRQKKPDRAALLYERAGDFAKAAELYMERRQYDRAELSLEKIGKLDEIGDMYLARGELPLAAKAFLRSKRFFEAAGALAKLGKASEAADAYRKGYTSTKAQSGKITSETLPPEIERVGLEAAKHLESVKDFKNAAEIYFEIKKIKEAARCLAESGNYKRAAELCEQAGDLEAASKYWTRSGDPKTAARLEGEKLLLAGQPQAAVSKFQEAGDFPRAAEIYLELHEPLKAALMYERAGDFNLAAPLYREAGKFEEAGTAYEKANDFEEAIACYRQGKLPEKEAALLKQIGDFVALAEMLKRHGRDESALHWLEQVGEKDPKFRKALSLKGKILLDRGDAFRAKEYLDQAVSMIEQLTSEDVDAVYDLAVVAEQTQTESKALDVLERALVRNLVEKDAVEKAQNVRKVLAERAFSRMAAIPPGGSLFKGAEAPPPKHLITAVKSSRYIPIKEIGRGGMGIVYTARDTSLDRVVALKILPESFHTNERAVQTFLREAKAAAALNHPNIVTVHDTGMQGGHYYIAMEYIDGRTIKEILKKRKKLSCASVLEVLKQLLAGLSYAHSKNVVHRDLTTNNIMWTQQKIVKIMDFGLAKMVRELMSEQSIIGGTPSFMSPEQTLGKPIDHRTDIYSLGICIYEMLIGALPFVGGDLGYHHLHTPPPNPREKDPQIPEVLSQMILRCMQKEPNERFQNIAEIQVIVGKIA